MSEDVVKAPVFSFDLLRKFSWITRRIIECERFNKLKKLKSRKISVQVPGIYVVRFYELAG